MSTTDPTATDVLTETTSGIDVTIGYHDYAGDDQWATGTIDLDDRRRLAAAVVAAIRGMTAEQLVELRPDLTVEHDGRRDGAGDWYSRPTHSRLVGPWRAEP